MKGYSSFLLIWRSLVLQLLLLFQLNSFGVGQWVEAAAAAAADDASATRSTDLDEKIDFGLADWVNSLKGGYFNRKQEIRREDDPSDPHKSIVGVFARERIEDGELLNRVPWEAIIMPEDDYEPVDDELEEEAELSCAAARKLAKEMRLGKDSRYAPYILYLLNQPHGQIPSSWSAEGRQLLQTVLGGTPNNPRIPPNSAMSWMEEDWFVSCSGDKEDELATQAAMLVVQRADDDLMVPGM